MEPKPVKKEGVFNFVDTMLKSADETKEVKPQNRYDTVDPAEIEKVMANLKKGMMRK
ncbi:MAG: hypothetical protein QT02_C0010G0004 [archaeon GW2011_AR9]|nr:MAG: hypothetical protein QT02_C0010G0004 [archaeon GW2011_AR9]MBS3120139.1 hypothetical protein [Candidatus Woesearchaeota archaeon]HIG92833.1 hypothetical protein [Candidatus Woesearchaeota archaeon]HIH12218.1 hypothetical protein [Candidatus Woesearchaeota archaeon]